MVYGPPGFDLVVHYTLSGLTSNGVDYAELSGTAVVPATGTNVTVEIVACDDDQSESLESVTLTLATEPYYSRGLADSASLSILDALDSDGDGLSDNRESGFYGSNPDDPDTDDDGMNDGDEVRAGTSPTDGESVLRVVSLKLHGEGIVLEWPSESGRVYSVWCANALLSGNWWVEQQGLSATYPTNTTTLVPGPQKALFYRIGVQ